VQNDACSLARGASRQARWCRPFAAAPAAHQACRLAALTLACRSRPASTWARRCCCRARRRKQTSSWRLSTPAAGGTSRWGGFVLWSWEPHVSRLGAGQAPSVALPADSVCGAMFPALCRRWVVVLHMRCPAGLGHHDCADLPAGRRQQLQQRRSRQGHAQVRWRAGMDAKC
jgi:hypothetical protein